MAKKAKVEKTPIRDLEEIFSDISPTKKVREQIIDRFFREIKMRCRKGEIISVPGFGIFKKVKRASRHLKNKFGDFEVPAKETVVFRVSSKLKQELNS